MPSDVQRKLTTILAADAEGYSREMATDEVRTLSALRAARSVFAKLIERHNGRIANTAGDGLIAEFPSVVEAVKCAVEVQRELEGPGISPEGGALRFRIGIHLGDVIVDGDDLLGEGVNLAARLQSMAEPGGILISQQVYDQVQRKLTVGFEYLGEKRPKNFTEDVSVYRISSGESPAPGARPGVRAAPAADGSAQRAPAGDARRRVVRRAAMFGVILVGLLAADLASGPPLWVQWPGIILGSMIAWSAVPLFAGGWLLHFARAMVIVAALALVNLFSWNGDAWFVWPAGIVLVIFALRRLSARST